MIIGIGTSLPRVSRAPFLVSAGKSYDAASQAAFAAMTVQPTSGEADLLDAMIRGMKADGESVSGAFVSDWSRIDWISLLAAETAQAGRLNLKSPSRSFSPINGPTFTKNRGFAGDGSTAYLDAGEVWNATGNGFALNSAHIGIWINVQNNVGLRNLIGNLQNNPREGISSRDTGGNESYQINQTGGDILQPAPGTRTGYRLINRTGAAATSGYYNGNKVSTGTTSSSAINSQSVTPMRSSTTYCEDGIPAVHWGSGLSDAAAARIFNRLNTYLTAKGAN